MQKWRRKDAKFLSIKVVSNRPKKLRQWSKELMLKALNTVASGKMGVNRAALEFNVLCTSLKIELQTEYLMAVT